MMKAVVLPAILVSVLSNFSNVLFSLIVKRSFCIRVVFKTVPPWQPNMLLLHADHVSRKNIPLPWVMHAQTGIQGFGKNRWLVQYLFYDHILYRGLWPFISSRV